MTRRVADHYTARYEFDGQHWLVEIEEIPQVHSFGRTLAKADTNVRDALALWLEVPDPDALRVVPNLQLDRSPSRRSRMRTRPGSSSPRCRCARTS